MDSARDRILNAAFEEFSLNFQGGSLVAVYFKANENNRVFD
jgi:hypothetical protein